MSRKSVENRLIQARNNENSNRRTFSIALGIGLGVGIDDITSKNIRNTSELTVTAISLGVGVIAALRAASHSRTAAALEQVLAQDELYQPDTVAEPAPIEEPVFHDWAENPDPA